MVRRVRGFKAVEMVVVLVVLVAVAGVLAPVVSGDLETRRRAAAQATVAEIAQAVARYVRDTSFAPTGKNGARVYHYLYTGGTSPANNHFASGESTLLADVLGANRIGTRSWNGPYLEEPGADPWGSRYLVNTNGFFPGPERVWVLSAGPNRRVDTGPQDTVAHGDDIGFVID